MSEMYQMMCAEDRQRCDCGVLEQALAMLPGAERMVVGHTIQVTPAKVPADMTTPLRCCMLTAYSAARLQLDAAGHCYQYSACTVANDLEACISRLMQASKAKRLDGLACVTGRRHQQCM